MDNLGDEDGGRFNLADAAAGIEKDKTEADDAGGADLAMAAGAVGNPLQGLRTHGTAILHLQQFLGSTSPRRRRKQRTVEAAIDGVVGEAKSSEDGKKRKGQNK